MPRRDRGRFLTDKGWNKIWMAIEARFADEYPDKRPPFEKISEKTDLHGDTISKILNRRAKADKPSIDALFKAFGLTVENDDLTSEAPYTPSVSADPNFVGRENDLAELDRLVQTGQKAILIVATGGIGKSRFVQEYLTMRFDPKNVREFNMARESQGVVSPLGRMEEWLKELGEEPGREFGISKERLRKKLRETSSKIAILIDNLEPTLENGLFIQPYRSEYVELFRVLTDLHVNSVTLITSREPLHESDFSVETYLLKGLDLKAWQQYFQVQNVELVETDSSNLVKMRDAYGGNAKAMEILCGTIRKYYDGDLEACWQELPQDLLRNPSLETLVTSQFDRLQHTNPNAYNLLCRLGCYRYQDVPLVPKAGVLCLLWDVPEKPWRVLDALQDRGLLDVSRQQYRLHPVIREVAIDRLRQNKEDWETANRKAAEFWTDSVETVVTVEDALQAFEAYWHYLEIQDFEWAGKVIIQMRSNKWDRNETLGSSFYRLGLIETMAASIQFILKDIQSGYSQSRLYNIIGDGQWLQGELNSAIVYYQNSSEIIDEILPNFQGTSREKFWLYRVARYCWFNISICRTYKLEIKEAIVFLKKLKKHYKPEQKIYRFGYYEDEDFTETRAYSAFLYSCIGLKQEAYKHIKHIKKHLKLSGCSSWDKGYTPLFLGLAYKNLGDLESSFEMYNKAISYAEDSKYVQVKAKALTGLGELHRIQGDFAKAIKNYQESIKLLDKIRAKCDLAEAYFQCALTYQAMGETANSQENFDEALKLFGEIDAPRQIERVQQAMIGGV